MSEELENKNESLSAGQTEGSREGYKQTEGFNNQRGDRPMRPRIRVQRSYTPNRSYNKEEGGFRPEGFGAGLQSQNGGQRPSPARDTSRVNRDTARTTTRRARRATSRASSSTANARRRATARATTRTRRADTSRASSSTARGRRRVTARTTTPTKAKEATRHAKEATNAVDTSATNTDSRAKEATTARADTASALPTTTRTPSTA